MFRLGPTPAGRPAASVYAVSMLLTAVVNKVPLVTLHAGPVASTEYINPVTSGHVTPIDAPVIGLVPIFPVMTDAGTSVIPVFVNIAKLPAVPSGTGGGPAVATVTVTLYIAVELSAAVTVY